MGRRGGRTTENKKGRMGTRKSQWKSLSKDSKGVWLDWIVFANVGEEETPNRWP